MSLLPTPNYRTSRRIKMDITFRKAEPFEITIAFSLLKDAAIWLNEKGIDYWQDWLNPPSNFKDWVKAGFNNNEFYFVEYENDIVGMYRLQYNDELFWGIREDRSGYIHSFTTKRNLKGKGIGNEILKHIETTLKESGIDYLRLDCSSKINGLCTYYENYGFRGKGTVSLFGDILNLYEKDLRAVVHAS